MFGGTKIPYEVRLRSEVLLLLQLIMGIPGVSVYEMLLSRVHHSSAAGRPSCNLCCTTLPQH